MKSDFTPKLVCVGRVNSLTRAFLITPPFEPGSQMLGWPV